jgi:hypothetical protein
VLYFWLRKGREIARADGKGGDFTGVAGAAHGNRRAVCRWLDLAGQSTKAQLLPSGFLTEGSHSMKPLLLTLPLVLLAACSSPGKLKEAPALRLESGKSPSVYMTCLLPKWQAIRSSSTVKEIRFGYRLLVPTTSGETAGVLLETTAADKGSDVSLYRRNPPNPDDAITLAARSCR